MTRSTVLITGGEGAIGSYCDFGTRLGRESLDVTDANAVSEACAKFQPTCIVHAAALVDLEYCEKHPEEAYRVNAAGAYHVARAARVIGAKMIYLSTSDIFDGTAVTPYVPEDTPNPMTTYGRSKHLGELAVKGLLDDYVILRLSWVFGGGPELDKKFVGKLFAKRIAPEVRVATDRKGSPSWGKDVAAAIQKLIMEDGRGVYHVGGGVATRYEMAQEMAASVEGWQAKLVPVLQSEFPSSYPVGENQSMPLSPLVRPWRESLREYLRTEWAAPRRRSDTI